jgi:enamine deaminase RidA (YjgF/YER057c/UK114 family)
MGLTFQRMNIKTQLDKLNLELPKIAPPGGNYVSVNVRGNIAYVAIQFPINGEQYFYQGKYGHDLSTDEGYQAAQLTALNVLAQIEHYIVLDNIIGLNHIDICYTGVDGWDDAPIVANGASDLFIKVLGEKGKHSRGIYGVNNLPRNFSIGITSSFTLKAK